MVTLTGPGGIGKTRVARAVGHAVSDQFDDGVWMVELSSLADGRDVPNASTIALGLSSRSSTSTAADVAVALGRQRRLIILDNCEHLIADAAALARAIVTACPNVVVLATSRERLRISDEHVVAVPPMSIDIVDGMSPAAQLFVERATEVLELRTVRPRSPCRARPVPTAGRTAPRHRTRRRAARRVGRARDPRSVGRSLRVAGATRPHADRHHSLLTTIEWSYDLLSPDEQRTFESLAVFVGDFDAAAAIAVSDQTRTGRLLEDLVGSLVEKSMVVATEHASGRRYALLDSLREFAGRRLDMRGQMAAVRRRHLDHYSEFVRRTDVEVRGADEFAAHSAMLPEWHNLRVAVATACELDDGVVATEMITNVLWWASAHPRRGRRVGRTRPPVAIGGEPPEAHRADDCVSVLRVHPRRRAPARALIAEARADEAQFGELTDPWIPAVEIFVASDPIAMSLETQRRARRAGNSFWEVLGILQEGVLRAEFMSHTEPAQVDGAAADQAWARDGRRVRQPQRHRLRRTQSGWCDPDDRPRARPGMLERAIVTAVPLGLELLAGQARGALARLLTSRGRPWDALHVMETAIEAHTRAGARSELDQDLATCAQSFVAVGNIAVAKVIVESVQVASPLVYDLFGL